MQPYGLTAERRHALAAAAAAPEQRLAQKRVCFIGMWGARKGAYDWPTLIEHVRREVPEAKFRFLGTMIEDDAVRRDLGSHNAEGVELISAYEPDELPTMLADCSVGAFLSHVEGFGLAVIEQLAAGIPTVAYDTAGPRDILQPRLAELLVPNGDVTELAAAICRILRFPPAQYQALSERCAALDFSWPTIANDTLKIYRNALRETAEPIVFVQPFSIGSAGWGTHSARAAGACADRVAQRLFFAGKAKVVRAAKPICPAGHPGVASNAAALRGCRSILPRSSPHISAGSLRDYCRAHRARAIHAVPHSGLDFSVAHAVARELSLPFFLSLHDDLAYTALGAVAPGRAKLP
ncbi:MAG: glycosyltransferase family 4 protein [Geodermatophilaceae bacterium]